MELDAIVRLVEYLLLIEARYLVEGSIYTDSITVNLVDSSFFDCGYHYTFKSLDMICQTVNN